ncbi:G-protein coupled receptor Mth2-like isoform X13 [Onthophagus taurus]|uniref:G-protein coupled receptor Mth2-like isoform X13 n=1 Tax=Onthophagus taurus TaxID=166361 RepID=UPI000C20471A|nr:G-protein coupled receptor Mth2-like isoform X13 [Onthophagus taurus]
MGKYWALLCMFLSVNVATLASRPCSKELSINISAGVFDDKTNKIIFDNLTFPKELTYYEDNSVYGCVCDVTVCVRKCCDVGKVIVSNETDSMSCEESDDPLNINNTFKYIYYKDDTCVYEITDFELASNGELTENDNGESVVHNFLEFCIDTKYELGNRKTIVLGCADIEVLPTERREHVHVGMIISMPFLIATFLVYALLPDKNLPAKSLMCYVLSLLFAYIMLVTIQLNSNLEHGACVTIAYLCYFFFMVSFFWMNSSCIDIWLTFSGIKGITGQRTQERKRFIYYCLYSWGLPLIMTSIVVVMTMEHLKDSIFFTAIGDGQCWFKNGLSTGIYFYFPIAILLITNIVLFAITALKIRNVQRDTKVLNAKDSSKHEKDKQRIDEYNSEPCYLIEPVKNRGMQVYDFLDVDNSCLGFNLYIKLLFAMGVNWSMEVISWLVQWQSNNVPTYIWYITDFCNAMYGVLIFFIFVFKKNIWIMLKKRYLQIMGRSTRAHSMGTSTHRTTLFTAISLQSIPGAGLLTKMHSTPNDNRNELRPPKIH